MKNINWNEVKATTDNTKLPAGGYVAAILNVEDISEKEYLKIMFDIAEGDFEMYYDNLYKKFDFWGGNMYRSYKEKAQGMFKGFLKAIEESNKGWTIENWNSDEEDLIGKFIGVVLGEEEYIGNDGNIKTRLKVTAVKSVDEIHNGKFKVPECKKIAEPSTTETFSDIDKDSPF